MKEITKQTYLNNYRKLDCNIRLKTIFYLNNSKVNIYYHNGFIYYHKVNIYSKNRKDDNIYLKFDGIDEFINFVTKNTNYKAIYNKNDIAFYCSEHSEQYYHYFYFDLTRNKFVNCL